MIRKGDRVRVISGRENGKEGAVLRVVPRESRVYIEKLNLVKRHTRPNPKNTKGGILEKEASLDLSNVMLVCTHCGKPARPGAKRLADGKKIRICRRCGEIVDRAG